jgi:hypothetical protein
MGLLPPYISEDDGTGVVGHIPTVNIDHYQLTDNFGGSDLSWIFHPLHGSPTAPWDANAQFFSQPITSDTETLLGSTNPQLPSPAAQEPASRYNEDQDTNENELHPALTAHEYTNRLVIPELGNPSKDNWILCQRALQLPQVQESDHTRIWNYVSQISRDSPWPSIVLEKLPGKATIDHCIDLFFLNFKPV